MEETQCKNVVVVKFSGRDANFIKIVVDTLKSRYSVILQSKLKQNDGDSGVHMFLTLLNSGAGEK